ncbi:amidohydrolase family protein [Pedobacter immunditicola]|uniref:amidohydrolase family protein n=1 Tax=Pedobacter immunditicola TaxID=3133440 RepID=UPI003096C3E8
MKQQIKLTYVCLGLLGFFLQSCTQVKSNASADEDQKIGFYSMEDFKSVEKYDTHVHLNVFDSTFIKQAREDNFRLLTVNVDVNQNAAYPGIEEQRSIAQSLEKAFPDRVAFSTAFNLDNWDTDQWQAQTLAYLEDSFKMGSIAVKIWKNIGMELKDKNGKFVMIDDPRFDPVIDFIEKNNITLIGHLGEPRNAWLPVEQMTITNDQRYFTNNPKYHMYKFPQNPSYEEEVDARDRMLSKHPNLRFVGAHLGSLEWNVDELAKRLDKFPRMAVDMAARIPHLQFQAVENHQKVYDFMVKYQDRLIYATDHGVDVKSDFEKVNESAHQTRLSDWEFFATDHLMRGESFDGEFRGLKLPKVVIDKIYHLNAEKWFPGI